MSGESVELIAREVIPAGTPVHIELDEHGMITPLLDTSINGALLPGQFEVLDLDGALPDPAPPLPSPSAPSSTPTTSSTWKVHTVTAGALRSGGSDAARGPCGDPGTAR